MSRLLLLIFPLLLLGSCSEQYNIAGNSTVQCLDGRMLYLRISPGQEGATVERTVSICLDSCKVVHGRFSFEGSVDSVMMAMLYTGNQCVMPLVIENGNISIQVDNAIQRVSGGPLNDRLYSFYKKRGRLDNELWELQQRAMRMMREGCTPDEIQRRVGRKADRLNRQTEELETNFVRDNYDNVLGPGFFRLLCSQYPTPILTHQIERIVSDAPAAFLNDPFVRYYLHHARLRAAQSAAGAATQECAGH